MKNENLYKRDTMSEGGNAEVPSMYLSPTNNASPSRLKDINVYNNLPYISEYLIGSYDGLSPKILFFKKHYTKPPLILGLIKNSSGVARKFVANADSNSILSSTTCKIYLNTGDVYKLRVYSLDIPE